MHKTHQQYGISNIITTAYNLDPDSIIDEFLEFILSTPKTINRPYMHILRMCPLTTYLTERLTGLCLDVQERKMLLQLMSYDDSVLDTYTDLGQDVAAIMEHINWYTDPARIVVYAKVLKYLDGTHQSYKTLHRKNLRD